jgi:hypothetical protein
MSTPEATLAISVVRTGGFAAVRRTWSIEPREGERAPWRHLVEACPWDAPPADDDGRDRFVWRIEVVIAADERAATIGERHLAGPWRELVDRVRDAAGERAPGMTGDRA